MATIHCGRTITLDLSQLSPGVGAVWAAGSPHLNFRDYTEIEGVEGNQIVHSYDKIGEYHIIMSGMNSCGEYCTHVLSVGVIEPPSSVSAGDMTPDGATITWPAVSGCSKYYWAVYQAGVLVTDGEATTNTVTLTGLSPGTYYTVEIASTISTGTGTAYSYDYCDIPADTFKTLEDICYPPTCLFTIES